MTTPRRTSSWLGMVKRVVSGVMPAADGGPPLAMRHAKTRLFWLLATGVGLALGLLVGFLVALAWQKMPDVPLLLLGMLVGVPLGAALALVVMGALGRARKAGGWAYLLTPLIVAGAPLLLLGSAWTAIRGRKR